MATTAQHYNLIASWYDINLAKLIDERGPDQVIKMFKEMKPEEISLLEKDPYFHLRLTQIINRDVPKTIGTFVRCGRGWGKNYCGSVFTSTSALKGQTPIAIIGETANDVQTKMIEFGPSSIMEIYKDTLFMPEHVVSKRMLTWPNGAQAVTYSGNDLGQVRGVSGRTAWADEVAKYDYALEFIENLELGMREKGAHTLIATTPLPTEAIKKLDNDDMYIKVQGSTLENMNHDEDYFERIRRADKNSVWYRQEVLGEVLYDSDLALWKRSYIDPYRMPRPTQFENIIIGVDPTTSKGTRRSDLCGIVVVGSAKIDGELHAFVLEDESIKGSPAQWAKKVKEVSDKYPEAQIIAEDNQGGEMVREVITKYGVSDFKLTLKKHINSKYDRAQPVASFAERGKIHHTQTFQELEDEMCSFTGDNKKKSPDRMDALVIAAHALLIRGSGKIIKTFMPF